MEVWHFRPPPPRTRKTPTISLKADDQWSGIFKASRDLGEATRLNLGLGRKVRSPSNQERYLWLPLATIDPEESAVLERLEHSTRRLNHALTGKFPSRPTMPKSL